MHDPATAPPPARPMAVAGARWALGFAVALLVAFALLTLARSVRRPASTEEIVQVPVPTAVPTPTPAVLAPDPGDNP